VVTAFSGRRFVYSLMKGCLMFNFCFGLVVGFVAGWILDFIWQLIFGKRKGD